MTLFDTGPALKVTRCRSNLHPQPCWHATCVDCGKVLSAFDETEDECRELGAGELAKHDCPARPQPPAGDQLTGDFPAGF